MQYVVWRTPRMHKQLYVDLDAVWRHCGTYETRALACAACYPPGTDGEWIYMVRPHNHPPRRTRVLCGDCALPLHRGQRRLERFERRPRHQREWTCPGCGLVAWGEPERAEASAS